MNQLVMQPQLIQLLRPGVFCIFEDQNVYIGYSKNMLKALVEQLSLIQDSCHSYISGPIDKLQIVSIETDPKNLKISQTYWADYYKAQGYQVLNSKRLLRYKTRIRVDNNFQVLVELVTKEYKSIICGVFAKVSEAEAYSKILESNNPIIPLIANNDLTLKYLEINRIYRN